VSAGHLFRNGIREVCRRLGSCAVQFASLEVVADLSRL
jgi:hypothetical protein